MTTLDVISPPLGEIRGLLQKSALLGHYLSNPAHLCNSAALLGSAFCRHFEYFCKASALGPDELEPDDPEPAVPPAAPPSTPLRPPSWLVSSLSGFAFCGAVIVCGCPTSAKSIENDS